MIHTWLPLLALGGGFAWNSPALWDILDFLVLAVLLVKFAGPPVGKVFAGKREGIARQVADSERVLAEARRALDKEQLGVQGEAAMLSDIAHNASAVAASLSADFERETAAEVSRAKEAIAAAIERERLAALAAVRSEILAAAFAEAERLIRGSLDASRQSALFASFAAKVQEIHP